MKCRCTVTGIWGNCCRLQLLATQRDDWLAQHMWEQTYPPPSYLGSCLHTATQSFQNLQILAEQDWMSEGLSPSRAQEGAESLTSGCQIISKLVDEVPLLRKVRLAHKPQNGCYLENEAYARLHCAWGTVVGQLPCHRPSMVGTAGQGRQMLMFGSEQECQASQLSA